MGGICNRHVQSTCMYIIAISIDGAIRNYGYASLHVHVKYANMYTKPIICIHVCK